MRLPTLLALLLFGTFVSSAALATPGVNLSWDACTAEGGVQNKTFACNSNSGSRTIYGSFVLANEQASFVGAEITIDLRAESDSLPAWWRFINAGACRSSALSISFDFSGDPGTSCIDPWGGQATGAIAGYQTYWTAPQVPSGDPSKARILAIASVPSTIPSQLAAGTEYYCFKLVISSSKTVGTGACGGCSTPVCLVLSRVKAVQSDESQESLTDPIISNVVTWQSAAGCANGPKSTWGQIRALMH